MFYESCKKYPACWFKLTEVQCDRYLSARIPILETVAKPPSNTTASAWFGKNSSQMKMHCVSAPVLASSRAKPPGVVLLLSLNQLCELNLLNLSGLLFFICQIRTVMPTLILRQGCCKFQREEVWKRLC